MGLGEQGLQEYESTVKLVPTEEPTTEVKGMGAE